MASTIGTSHITASQPCQDSHGHAVLEDSSGGRVMVLVAADGAGSASVADVGSALACETFVKLVADYIGKGGRVADISRPLAERWIAGIVYGFGLHAETRGLELADYACTLLAAIVGENATVFVQIGDGAIVHSDGAGGWSWVFWPQHGEFANTTNFITSEGVSETLAFRTTMRPFEEIAIFTDGLENLVLRKAEQAVHGPFFDSMFRSVRHSTASGLDAALSRDLARYLGSALINQRTDDDKTLILASRRIDGAGSS